MARRIGYSWLFLSIILVTFAVITPFKPGLIRESLTFFAGLLFKFIPALILIFGLMLMVDLLLDEKRIARHIGQTSGLRGLLVALLAGNLFLGPSYVWYGTLRDLREKGMRTSLVAVFLLNRPVKVLFLPLMIHYFGVIYTAVLISYIAVFAVTSGLIIERMVDGGGNRT